ncbi:hypothetical protein PanWU01x14_323700 [Parasponia andersonii]|uniref:Uncharacterized protein n=1 Tax=Parasponia andersonii TaxID=3476 RepID=A0A2P5AKF0_PARAD|nr:hypothetical protein PanWU01x14_323700 [Parasponia andersonii]
MCTHLVQGVIYLKPSGWRNEYTQEKYAEMVMSRVEALTQTQSRAQFELRNGASSAESVVGPEQVNEFQIMSKALGTRSRWQKGLGALPQLKKHALQIDETEQQMAEKEAENQRRLEETQQQLNEQN